MAAKAALKAGSERRARFVLAQVRAMRRYGAIVRTDEATDYASIIELRRSATARRRKCQGPAKRIHLQLGQTDPPETGWKSR